MMKRVKVAYGNVITNSNTEPLQILEANLLQGGHTMTTISFQGQERSRLAL